MKRERYIGTLLIVIATAFTLTGCNHAKQGEVLIETKWNRPIAVHRANDASTFQTWYAPGADYDDVDVRQFTIKSTPRVFSKDNAGLNAEVSVTAHIDSQDDQAVLNYVANYGREEEQRHKRREEVVDGWILTASKEAFNKYDAYAVFSKQQEIQSDIQGTLTPVLEKQIGLVVDSIQLGNLKFEDARIEQQAAALIAASKQQAIAEAYLNAQKTDNETKALQAQVFKDPNMLAIKRLELELAIEQARADGIKGHQGPLTLITPGQGVQLQVHQ